MTTSPTRSTFPSRETYEESITRLHDALNEADVIVVGAGAGLSTAAGFTYSGDRFHEHFADFEERYDIHDMYLGSFYPFPSRQAFWAFMSRVILLNRYTDATRPVYENLLEVLDGRDYFVITTNVDHCFQKAGFPKDRLFYTQGDYGLFQCSEPCCDEVFDNEAAINAMVEQQRDLSIPDELLPVCPHCGRPMTMNLRSDNTFVENDGWRAAADRALRFLSLCKESKALFFEIGVGYNTPAIIKYPFWRMTYQNACASYACVNYREATCPRQIADRSICLNADIDRVVADLLALR